MTQLITRYVFEPKAHHIRILVFVVPVASCQGPCLEVASLVMVLVCRVSIPWAVYFGFGDLD